MNIFVVDRDPYVAAQNLCDAHVVKMILESAQMLSTYLKWNGVELAEGCPKPTHINHPCNRWLREHHTHPNWLYIHLNGLLDEYEFRYNKEHSYKKLKQFYRDNISHTWYVPAYFSLAMPDEFKTNDPVDSYRDYYVSKYYTMKRTMKWTNREVPKWFTEGLTDEKKMMWELKK